ncbi:hypothetical protein ACFQXA_14230 [Nocardiopsis composta]
MAANHSRGTASTISETAGRNSAATLGTNPLRIAWRRLPSARQASIRSHPLWLSQAMSTTMSQASSAPRGSKPSSTRWEETVFIHSTRAGEYGGSALNSSASPGWASKRSHTAQTVASR